MHTDTKKLLMLVPTFAFSALILWIYSLGMIHVPQETAELEHYYHHDGIKRALFIYLAIAASIMTIVTLGVSLLTYFRLDKERGQVAHH